MSRVREVKVAYGYKIGNFLDLDFETKTDDHEVFLRKYDADDGIEIDFGGMYDHAEKHYMYFVIPESKIRVHNPGWGNSKELELIDFSKEKVKVFKDKVKTILEEEFDWSLKDIEESELKWHLYAY